MDGGWKNNEINGNGYHKKKKKSTGWLFLFLLLRTVEQALFRAAFFCCFLLPQCDWDQAQPISFVQQALSPLSQSQQPTPWLFCLSLLYFSLSCPAEPRAVQWSCLSSLCFDCPLTMTFLPASQPSQQVFMFAAPSWTSYLLTPATLSGVLRGTQAIQVG